MMDELKVYEDKMQKTIDNLQENFQSIRAGRANPHVLDKIRVNYYGTMTPLQQVGNISVPEARVIVIQPWERNMIKEIEKAINMSDIGINPTNDGQVVRLVFPELNEERRKDLAKQIKKYGEEAKVAVRNIRRDANDKTKKLEKDGEYTEDDLKQADKEVQKFTDDSIKTIDSMIEEKTKEIMTVEAPNKWTDARRLACRCGRTFGRATNMSKKADASAASGAICECSGPRGGSGAAAEPRGAYK